MTRSLVFVIIFAAFFSVSAFAAEKPIAIEVTGEAFGSDLEAPREVYERAKSDGQRSAIEQVVGTFILSHTVVSNGQLAEDLVHARVRGRVEKMEVLSQERDKDDPQHYQDKLRVTVLPVFGDKTEGITIRAALSRSKLLESDAVQPRRIIISLFATRI